MRGDLTCFENSLMTWHFLAITFRSRRQQVLRGYHGSAVLDRAWRGEPALGKPVLLHGSIGQQPRAQAHE